jgi:hypothetical protein
MGRPWGGGKKTPFTLRHAQHEKGIGAFEEMPQVRLFSHLTMTSITQAAQKASDARSENWSRPMRIPYTRGFDRFEATPQTASFQWPAGYFLRART